MQALLKKEFPQFINKIVFVLCCLFIYPLEIIKKASAGLDSSWEVSINLALKNKFIWGKDFVFSYGPLGYLATGLGENVNNMPIYLFRLGMYFNLCLIFYKILQTFKVFTVANMIAIFLFVVTIHNYIYCEASTYLLMSCIFWLCYSIKYDHLIAAIFAIGISILMFFVKMDTGIIVNAFTILFFLFQSYYSVHKKLYPILWIGNYTLLLLFAYLLHINLFDYLLANIHVINSYNDAMYLPNTNFSIILFSIVLLFFLCLLIQNYTQIVKTPYKIIITLYLMMFLFVLFKHGFVRHYGFTFFYPPLSLAIVFLFAYFIHPEKIFFSKALIVTVIPVSFVLMTIHNIEDINKNDGKLFTIKLNVLNAVSRLILHKNYVPPISKLNGVDAYSIPYILPIRIKNEIGNGSVDIIPHLVSTIYFNKLNYNPRPGIQTYANYDGFLDSLGSAKYLSSTAPDYIIYCAENIGFNAAIDNRYPFFDEPKTKISMLQNYSVVDSFDNQLLLKRRNKVNGISISNSINSESKFCDSIDIPSSNELQVTIVKTQYSLLGKLVRFLYQPPSLNVTVTLNDGKQFTYKAIKPTIEEGVIVNRLIVTNKDAKNLFDGNLSKIAKISKICFWGDKWGFNSKINLTTKYISCKEVVLDDKRKS